MRRLAKEMLFETYRIADDLLKGREYFFDHFTAADAHSSGACGAARSRCGSRRLCELRRAFAHAARRACRRRWPSKNLCWSNLPGRPSKGRLAATLACRMDSSCLHRKRRVEHFHPRDTDGLRFSGDPDAAHDRHGVLAGGSIAIDLRISALHRRWRWRRLAGSFPCSGWLGGERRQRHSVAHRYPTKALTNPLFYGKLLLIACGGGWCCSGSSADLRRS